MFRTVSAVPKQHLLVALAFTAVVTLPACSDGVASPGAVAAASDGSVIVDEKETIAGVIFALTAGTCPKGYELTAVKPGHIDDANKNGWICVSGLGDTVDDDAPPEPGACPDGYELVLTKPGNINDLNGNGWVCASETDVVDDEAVVEDRMQVNGHGNFAALGKKGEQDLSFSFHAIPQGTEFDGKGKFEFHDLGNGLNVHGSVLCVATQGGQAFIAAVVTRSDDTELPVGATVGWFARDSGEPGDGVDGVTRPSQLKKGIGTSACSGAKFPGMSTIRAGNIQVH